MLASPLDRRGFMHAASGLGVAAVAELLARGESPGPQAGAGVDLAGGLHHRAKARRVIQLFMNGGASQMDLFDHKPLLFRDHGKVFDPGSAQRVEAATSTPGRILAPPFPLRQHGESGRWVSDLLPGIARHVDQMAFLMAMTSRTNVHGPASYLMNTGFLLPGFPAAGAWVSYALGSLADDLPTFVVLPDARGLPYNQKGNFGAGFLSPAHQGTIIQPQGGSPIADLRPPASAKFLTAEAEREGQAVLARLNARHLAARGSDPQLEARIRGYELAARMQLSAPEAFDLDRETAVTRQLYGLEDEVTADFGRRCLTARRLVERGVRFVQVWSGAGGPTGNWDNHSSIVKELAPRCRATDAPIAGLLTDLAARGLLADTLVVWSTEFGRMPFSQGSEGRDHNGGTFVGWFAGAGVKPGVAHGESDPWSWKAARDATTTYDFHATLLHLLGIDHERLSVRHNGADRRLTDVHGHVVKAVLA
jgi:hypothetical protein